MSARATTIVYRSNLHSKLFGRYNTSFHGHQLLFSTTAKLQRPALHQTLTETLANSESAILSNHNRAVGLWLLSCGGLVFGMVVIGGLTRLTKSGLSMVSNHWFKSLYFVTIWFNWIPPSLSVIDRLEIPWRFPTDISEWMGSRVLAVPTVSGIWTDQHFDDNLGI